MELTDYKALPVDQIAQSLFGPPAEGSPRSQWIRWRNTPLGTVSVHRVLRSGERYQWWTASTLLNPNQGAKNALNLVLAVQNAGSFPTDPASVARACRELDTLGGIALSVPWPQSSSPAQEKPYVPIKDERQAWLQVVYYLTHTRKLPKDLIQTWHAQGRIRAVAYGHVPYAVFPLKNSIKEEVGAVLRCAGNPQQQRAQVAKGYQPKRVAAGSHPDQGYWSIGSGSHTASLMLVESPIDAMALYAIATAAHKDPSHFVIRACTGENLNATHWQGEWEHVIAAFDRDEAGERFTRRVLSQTPIDVIRLTPPQGRKDWAEAWVMVQARPRNRETESPAHRVSRPRSRGADIEYELGDD